MKYFLDISYIHTNMYYKKDKGDKKVGQICVTLACMIYFFLLVLEFMNQQNYLLMKQILKPVFLWTTISLQIFCVYYMNFT